MRAKNSHVITFVFMRLNKYIFRSYDIRGIVPDDLDEEKTLAIARAYGKFLRKRRIKIAVVGHDCRLSGESFSKQMIEGLLSSGIDVIDIGMVMTQMVYFAQYHYKSKGGVMITASHNPAHYNGFKIAVGYSVTTEPHDLKEIKKYAEKEDFIVAKKRGRLKKGDVEQAYLRDLKKKIKLKKRYKVVSDSRHGSTGKYIKNILSQAGCRATCLRTRIDGSFPAGTPDPTDEDIMEELGREVKKRKADIGFCYDGDGDRVGMVDDRGRILWNDVMVAIFAKEILGKKPGAKIIYNTLCSKMVPEVIRKNGGKPIIWRTGHSFIKAKIAKEKAAFGGELSGHFFFKDGAYGHDDGTYATLRILRYLEKHKVKLSDLYDTFPRHISSPEIKIGCPEYEKKRVIKKISKKFKKDFPEGEVTDDSVIPGDDGVRIVLEDGMIVFRYSQNGPYITIRFEAKTQEAYNRKKKYVKKMLKNHPEMIWEDELCVNLDSLD